MVPMLNVQSLSGSGEEIAWSQLGYAALGTFGASACANTLNQVYEVANDARMKRTMMRPLPLRKISNIQALAFAAVMGIGGTVILAEKASPLALILPTSTYDSSMSYMAFPHKPMQDWILISSSSSAKAEV